MPKVTVVIDAEGNIQADFMGFPGMSCQRYEETLRDLLQQYGVTTQGRTQRKPPAVMAAECEMERKNQGRSGVWSTIRS